MEIYLPDPTSLSLIQYVSHGCTSAVPNNVHIMAPNTYIPIEIKYTLLHPSKVCWKCSKEYYVDSIISLSLTDFEK